MRKPLPTSLITTLIVSTSLAAACSDSSDGPPLGPAPGIDSIRVTGAPGNYIIAGQQIGLSAVALTSEGSVVAGAPIEWSSSDTGVVTVTGAGEIQAKSTGFARVTAASGRATASVDLEVREAFTVGPAGGTWVLASGRVALTLSEGAVAVETLLQLREVRDQPGPPNTIPGTHFELSPPLSVEPGRLSLTVRYRDELIPAGMVEQSALLHFLRDEVWYMGSSWRDTVENSIVNGLSHVSRFAVAGAPVDTVVVQSPVLDEAVYAGGSAAFATSVWTHPPDAFRGIELVGHPVTWSSSEPSVGAVDAMGVFHARSPGETTLTAAAAGAATSTRIRVLPPPHVRLSGLPDWVTLGGNARHDGYVPAVIDPSRYRLAWTSAPFASVRGLATGGGRVYAGYANGLRTFSASDGSLLWNTDARSSAPAYARERVYLLEAGQLTARNAATGDTSFTTAGSAHLPNDQPPVVDAGVVYVNADVAKAVDASSGTVIWRRARAAEYNTTAAVSQDHVFFRGDVLGSGQATDVVVLEPGTGTRARETLRAAGRNTPVVGDRWLLSSGSRSIAAWDVARPTAPVWSKQSGYLGLPVVANGVVYAVNYRAPSGADEIRAVEAIREVDGTPLWSWTPRQFDYPVGPMLVTDNLLFVGVGMNGRAHRTVAVDLQSGKAVWGYPAGGVIALDAAGRLFIGDYRTGEILSFKLH